MLRLTLAALALALAVPAAAQTRPAADRAAVQSSAAVPRASTPRVSVPRVSVPRTSQPRPTTPRPSTGETLGRPVTYQIQWAGEARSFQVYVPRSLGSVTSRSALLLLHGTYGESVSTGVLTNVFPYAEAEGFVAVLPMTTAGRSWSDGRASEEGHDDVGYLQAVVNAIVSANKVDRARVFVGGMSSGGMMAQRLACEAATTYAGAVSVVANMPTPLRSSCRPARPLPMILEFGAEDPLATADGGPFGPFSTGVISREDTVAFWTSDCGKVQQSGDVRRFTSCAGGTSRDVYVMAGAEHEWPQDFTQVIVDFLERFGL